MCSALSGEINKNPSTIFRKKRRGVFGILAETSLEDEISSHKDINKRLFVLKYELGLRSDLIVFRKAFFLLSRVFELSNGKSIVTMMNDKESVIIDLKEYKLTRKLYGNLNVNDYDNVDCTNEKIRLPRDIHLLANKIRNGLNMNSMVEVIDFSILLLEIAIYFQRQGVIELQGAKGSNKIRILNAK